MTLAAIFDLDDTLYPERSYNFSGFDAVGGYIENKFGINGFSEICKLLYEKGERGDIFDRACNQIELNLPLSNLIEIYRQHYPKIELFEDANFVLRTLHGHLPLGLITDGYASVQRLKIGALGIDSLFQSIVVSDDFGREYWKPSARPYKQTEEQLSGKANRYVYIGDNPTKDFITARKLGWSTVMIDRPTSIHNVPVTQEYQADYVVSTLRDIPWNELRGICPTF